MGDIRNEFVPIELADRLQLLGFNEPCIAWYYGKDLWMVDQKESEPINYRQNPIRGGNGILAPTWKSAFKWFREKYSLYTELHKKFDGIGVSIILSEYRHDMRQDKEVEYHIPKYFGTIYKSYEEAELACLEKLCEIVENKSE